MEGLQAKLSPPPVSPLGIVPVERVAGRQRVKNEFTFTMVLVKLGVSHDSLWFRSIGIMLQSSN